jgi:hypothetical protein
MVGLLRALESPARTHGIALSLVAPGMTETPLLETLPAISNKGFKGSLSVPELESLFDNLKGAGIPSQKPDVVGKAIKYLAERGIDASGVGLFVQGGEIINIEEELVRTMPEWLNERMSYLVNKQGPVWKEDTL